MKTWILSFFGFVAFAIAAQAEVAPVAIRVPETKAWTGQRVTIYVELRAPGTFVGSPYFELPQIGGALLIKNGNPVTSSQQIEGATWFVQTHEFSLFSQRTGQLEIPAFSVSFSRREGFVGPATDVKAQTSPVELMIQRPPDTEQLGFLVTTESFDVTETWDIQPGPAQIGAMFKRTIIQRAQSLPGMALAPAPTTAPSGIKVYPGDPQTRDDLVRGNFLGERRETIAYLLQKPGSLTLPALRYVWWNPKLEKLQSITLPAATFEVTEPPTTATSSETAVIETVSVGNSWPSWLGIALIIALIVWQRGRLAEWIKRSWQRLNPPDRVAARQLLRACRSHDSATAAAAWSFWRNLQADDFRPGPELHAAVLAMQRHHFGPASVVVWSGDDLAQAFRRTLVVSKTSADYKPASALPELNPRH